MRASGWLLLLALAGPDCAGKMCTTHNSLELVVPGDAACPSVAEAQARLDAGKHASDEKVLGPAEKTFHPGSTVCWYRMDIDDECPESSRAALLSQAAPLTDTIACDDEGWLYGQVSSGGADACPATIMPESPVLPFVGADDFPARSSCSYRTSYAEPCADVGAIPYGPE